MSIIQISKIQQRSGNLVDLPQLDEAEFGWASDAKRLFIGKTTPNENIEVLTSYSQINYSQINGSVGNLNISNVTVADGQILTYDGNNWVNRGGDAGGLITLGNVSNVKITGGAIGYVLETDGQGNLSWTPKSSIIAYIQNVTKANPAVVTTTQDNFLTDGMEITITNASGMTQLNGNTYYANVLTSNTFSLYSDPSLTTTVNSTGYGQYSYTTATSTSASTNRVTIGNSALFNLNQEVLFLGDLSTSGLLNNVSYYIKSKPSGTTITISEELLANGSAGNTKVLTTATLTGANVYAAGGRAIASVSSGAGGNGAAGSNTTVQFNNSNLLDGDADFTWNFGASPKVLGINGNANVGNLNASGITTATRFISNIATGTAPLAVTSTTRVANLNVSYANVSDFQTVTAQNTGTYYPVFVSGATSANYALGANANISFNAATGNLSVTLLNVTSNANVGNLGASGAITATGNVTGGNLSTTGALSVTGNANVGNIGTATAIITTGNITTVNTGLVQNGTSNVTITSGGNVTLFVAGNANARFTATSTGVVANGTLSVSGNANVGNLGTTGLVTATGNVSGGNLTTAGALSVTGNANVGNIGAAAGVFTANVTAGNVYANSGTVGANVITGNTISGTLSTALQPNITSVGTLTSLGVSGNITAANITANTGIFAGNGSGLTALNASNISTGTLAQARLANASVTLGSTALTLGSTVTTVTGLTSVTSTTFTGTLTTNAQPNITSVGTLTSLSVSGNANVGNIGATNFVGSGASLTNLNASNLASGTVPSARLSGTYSITVSGSATTAGTVTTNAQPNITSVGTLTSLGVTGNVTAGNVYANLGTVGAASVLTTALTTGANTISGTVTGNWTLTAGSQLQATYADLAEYYEADDIYVPGTVVMFGGEKEVTLAEDGTNKVAGVVSTNPAYVMNATCPGLLTAVALQGRVPCKVRGKIKKGDMMISGGNGFARPEQFPTIGTVIGKALQDFDGYEGVIEVAVGRL